MKKGLTLAEMIVTVALLGLLMTSVLAIYLSGTRVFHKNDARAELLGEAQVLAKRLSQDLEQSSLSGVTLGPESIAFLSPIKSRSVQLAWGRSTR